MHKNQKWTRVSGTDLHPQNEERRLKHDGILKSERFNKACEAVGIQPTRRQASKYARKKGAAYHGIPVLAVVKRAW